MSQKSLILIVLDGVGVGEAPDASIYGDEGSNTLKNVTDDGSLQIPNLKRFGLYNILGFHVDSLASWGSMIPHSVGKSTVEGHWEMMGKVEDVPFQTFPDGLPAQLLDRYSELIGRECINAGKGSGTEFIDFYGMTHMETGKPIVYTSADSVFQVAAHENIIPVQELYQICQIARDLLDQDYNVARVIARPFVGEIGNFVRTSRRKDFVQPISGNNTLSVLKEKGVPISAIGRITDLFGQYADFSYETVNNLEALDFARMCRLENRGLVFANLEDFDMSFGHRRDPEGFAESLCMLDLEWTRFTLSLGNGDLLLVVSDHGNDPTFAGHTDHTREYTMLLAYMKGYKGIDLGVRNMVDVGATVLDFFGFQPDVGQSFLPLVKSKKKKNGSE